MLNNLEDHCFNHTRKDISWLLFSFKTLGILGAKIGITNSVLLHLVSEKCTTGTKKKNAE
jgi:hypothetical protein